MHQLDVVVAVVEGVVGEDLLGLYLHGSAVHDELRPASDIDLMAVTRRSLTQDSRVELWRRLSDLSGPGHSLRSVDLATVVLDDVVPWTYPGACDFRFDDSLGDPSAAAPSGAQRWLGLAVEVARVLAGDSPLVGPPPCELLEPVPTADLARSGRDGIPGLLARLPKEARDVVLTLACVWLTATTGEVRSKDEAATWALPRLPPEHQPVLEHALRLYRTTTYADESWPNGLRDEVPVHVEEVLARIVAV